MDMNAGAVNIGVGAVYMAAGVVDMVAVNMGDEDAGMNVKLSGRNVGG